MGFFQDVKACFGEEIFKIFQDLIDTHIKLSKLNNRRNFLLQCRYLSLFPKHIQQNVSCLYTISDNSHPYMHEVDKIALKLKKDILNLEIKITHWRIAEFKKDMDLKKTNLVSSVPKHIFEIMNNIFKNRYNVTFIQTKRTHLKKIEILRNQTISSKHENPENWLVNLTGQEIPEEVKHILSFGPKFSLNHNNKDFPIIDILKDVEYLIQNLPEDRDKNQVRAQCTNVITNFKNTLKNNKRTHMLERQFDMARLFLKQNDHILVTKADKGNTTVIMLKTDYKQKMTNLLNDNNIYRLLEKDMTTTFENRANKIIKELLVKDYIDVETYKGLVTNNSVAPKIYGLPKTHKQGIPLRPVVSCTQSPLYNASKFIHDILSNLNDTLIYSVKHSFEFVDRISNVIIPPNYKLVSLDVQSLFSNIPKQLVLDTIDKLWQKIKQHTNIPKDIFFNILSLIFDSSFLQYDNKFYLQIFGCAMGNPVSPCLANLIMNELLKETVTLLPFKVPILIIYVDDIFTAIPEKCETTTLQIFNSYNEHLQFTLEVEANKSIPFLDTLVTRSESGHLLTDWYRKPTSSDRIIHFKSGHPLSQKIGIIKGLKIRALKLSHPSFHKNNLNRIRSTAYKNGFPKNIINKILNENMNADRGTNNDIQLTYYKIPLIPGLSGSLVQILRSDNTNIVTYPLKTVNLLFSRTKDQTPTTQRSGVVYSIPCAGCDKQYVGITKNKLSTRLKQHKYDCYPYNYHKKDKTALSLHHFDTRHNFNFEGATILHCESNYKKRLIAEMLYIKKYSFKNVNFRQDIQGISAIYHNLIK